MDGILHGPTYLNRKIHGTVGAEVQAILDTVPTSNSWIMSDNILALNTKPCQPKPKPRVMQDLVDNFALASTLSAIVSAKWHLFPISLGLISCAILSITPRNC